MRCRCIAVFLLLVFGLCGSSCLAGEAETEMLNVYFSPSGGNLGDLSMVNELLNDYLQEKLGISVRLVMPDRNYHQRLHADLLEGEQVDLAFCNDGTYLHEWIQNGWLNPLDALLQEYGEGIPPWIADEYMYREDGTIYGVGNNVERGRSFGFEYLLDVAEACGIDMGAVHTVEDLTDVFAQVKARGEGIIPPVVYPSYMKPEDMLGNNKYGVLMSPEDTTVVNLFETEAYWQFLDLVYQWTQSGYTYDRLNDSNNLLYYMTSGEIFGALCTGKSGFAAQESFLTGKNIGYIELTPYTLYSNAVNRSYCYVIPKTASSPETSMQLLNLLYNDAYIANLLLYGMEGVHYTKTSAHSVLRNPGNQYCGVNGYTYCNQYVAYTFDGAPETLWQDMIAIDATAPALQGLWLPV